MFDLSEHDLELPILEYGCGPSAINALLHDTNPLVVSMDPLFTSPKVPLVEKVMFMFNKRAQQLRENKTLLDVSAYGGLEDFIAYRRQGVELFFKDFEQGLVEQRYRSASLDLVPFADFTFNLALSSHYFFADEDDTSLDDHLTKIRVLARMAKEVRIFPLLNRPSVPSAYLGPVLLGLQQENYGVEVREVSCSLYPAGNAMLRVWAQECVI